MYFVKVNRATGEKGSGVIELDDLPDGIGLPAGANTYTITHSGGLWIATPVLRIDHVNGVVGIGLSATNPSYHVHIHSNKLYALYVQNSYDTAAIFTSLTGYAIKSFGKNYFRDENPFVVSNDDEDHVNDIIHFENYNNDLVAKILNSGRIFSEGGIDIIADSFDEIPIRVQTLTGGGNTLLIFGDGSVNTLEIDDDGSIIQRKYNETDNFLEFIRPGSWATPDRSVYLVDPSGRVISQNSVSVQPLDGIESGSPAFEVMFPELFTSNFAEYKRGGIDYFIVDYLGNLLSKGDVASEQSVIATKSFVLGGTKGFSKEVRFYNEFDNDTGSVADAEIFLDGENGSRFQIPENSTGKGRIEFSYLNLNSDYNGWLTAEFRIRWYNTGVGLTLTATLVDMDENGGSTMVAPAISTYTDGDDDYIQIEQTVPNGYNEQMYAWGQFNITQIIS